MACDDYTDLEELGIEDELTVNFTKAASNVQNIASKLDTNDLLILYGYYKQGLEGHCSIPKPSWYDMKAKAKWEAWNKLGDMPNDKAKTLYISLVSQLDPNFDASSSVDKNSKEGWVTVSTLQQQGDPDESNKNLVDFIKQGDHEKVAEFIKPCNLVEVKTNINELDEDGLGLIHWAADRGSVEILKILISFGASVNLQDEYEQTPLHYAVSCGHIDCIEYLLQNGADSKIKDSDGMDCFAAASDETVESLLRNFEDIKL